MLTFLGKFEKIRSIEHGSEIRGKRERERERAYGDTALRGVLIRWKKVAELMIRNDELFQGKGENLKKKSMRQNKF